jgi:uncharacterized protein YbjT (DUF2867 family)
MSDHRAAPNPRPARGILVTGASGTLGQAVVTALVAAGESVVAGVRDPRARLAAGAKWASGTAGTGTGAAAGAVRPAGKPERPPNRKPERNPAHKPVTLAAGTPAGRGTGKPGRTEPAAASGGSAGAEVRGFDFGDRGTWPAALAGVDRVVLIRPTGMTDVGRTVIPFIDAAMDLGVRHLVFVSQLGVPFDTGSPQHAVERYLKRSRAPHTVVRPNVLLQTLTTLCRDDIRLRNEIVLPAGNARVALVDARDVAAVIARLLAEPGTLRTTYTVSGEQALDYRAVAGILSDVLGRPIDYSAPSAQEYSDLLARQGAPVDASAAQQDVFAMVRGRGAMWPNRVVRRLTGRPAVSVRRFIEEHRDVWN